MNNEFGKLIRYFSPFHTDSTRSSATQNSFLPNPQLCLRKFEDDFASFI